MNMFLPYLGPILSGIAALAGLVAGAGRPDRERQRLRADADLLAVLPSGGTAAKLLTASIDRRVKNMVDHEDGATREVFVGVLAGLTAVACGYGTYWLADRGGLWWVLAVLVALFGLICAYGAGESFVKIPRDEKGNRRTTQA